uniref:RRM domain-containing protein n=1 Tax=Heterorhabditis bacteriophora TaxID=37862 RepID=A0A1I7XTP1_HETBA
MNEDPRSISAAIPLDPDADTIKMFVGQVRCCFVTYYHRRDAIAAQSAMHNVETIEGMHHPVQMKPADTENRNERKLFVGQLSKRHTEEDVRGFFSRFGHIEDCSVLRESDGKSRGCAFVTFSTRSCAMNAIKEMHHSQTMEGCSAPLVVKFADTQKEKDIKKQPAMAVSVSPGATGLGALGSQAALLQQLTGGGLNIQALGALAALLNPGLHGQQQNLLGVLGNVLSALGKLTDGSGTASSPAHSQNGQSSNTAKCQLAALLQQAQQQPQGLDVLAQLQQAQLAQAQQQQSHLLALQGLQQQVVHAQQQQQQPTAYGYAGTHAVAASTAAASYPTTGAQFQSIYQNAGTNGVQNAAVAAAVVKAASPVTTLQSSASLAHLGGATAAVDPYQQAIQQFTLSALANSLNTGQSVATGNGDVKGPEGSNLFIYHLPQDFGDSDLHSTFSPFGTVLSAKVYIDKVTNLSKCFGFVSYDNAISAQNAISAMNGFQIGAKRLKVQLKNERSHPYPKVVV